MHSAFCKNLFWYLGGSPRWKRAKRAATRCSRYHGPRPLDVVPRGARRARLRPFVALRYIVDVARSTVLDVVAPRRGAKKVLDTTCCMVHGHRTTTHGTPSEARRLDVVGRAKRDPQILCQGKKPPKGAAATICRIDLYVVGLRQIFAVKILDMVCCKNTTVNRTSNLLISRNYLWKRLVSR